MCIPLPLSCISLRVSMDERVDDGDNVGGERFTWAGAGL